MNAENVQGSSTSERDMRRTTACTIKWIGTETRRWGIRCMNQSSTSLLLEAQLKNSLRRDSWLPTWVTCSIPLLQQWEGVKVTMISSVTQRRKNLSRSFCRSTKKWGGHFQRKDKDAEELIEDQEEDDGEADKEEEVDEIEPNSTLHLMGRKNLSTAFYNHQVYQEMNERKQTDQVIFGPKENPQDPTQSISHKESLEDYMRSIDSLRRNELYEHTSSDCSGPCRRRGCGKLASIDGNHSCKNVKISTKQSFDPK